MTSFTLPTSQARERLSMIVHKVQDPRAYCVLTRHGKPVAAIVSMAELERIWTQQDVEDIARNGKRPAYFHFGKGDYRTNAEAAEAIQQMQLDRRMEREVLAAAGLEPIPGGELEAVAREKRAEPRGWWQRWLWLWRPG